MKIKRKLFDCICANCGRRVSEDAAYCDCCGSDISKSIEAGKITEKIKRIKAKEHITREDIEEISDLEDMLTRLVQD